MNPIWQNLTLTQKIRRILWIIVFSVSMSMTAIGIIAILILLIDNEATDAERYSIIVMTAVGAVFFAISFFWSKFEFHDYKLKYYFLGNKFNKQFDPEGEHFRAYPEEFRLFRKTCTDSYRSYGKISGNYRYYCKRNLNTDDGIKTFFTLVSALNDCCESKGGFEEFIARCDNGEFRFYDKATEANTELDSWDIYSYLSVDTFSVGFCFLIGRAYAESDFTLADNGLSPSYSEKVKERRKKLNDTYSPILFSYRDEIKTVIEKINKLM